jgi:acyl-CoA reductase-like NAD-dependent aldehyde dehydrogenase
LIGEGLNKKEFLIQPNVFRNFVNDMNIAKEEIIDLVL